MTLYSVSRQILPASLFSLLLSFFLQTAALGEVTLSPLFAPGCVLQKDKPIQIFGNARPQEIVTAEIAGLKGSTTTSSKGRFLITLPPLLPAGGPYSLKVKGQNSIVVNNIHIGEVWLLLGDNAQDKASEAIEPDASANFSRGKIISVFRLKENLAAAPQRLTKGKWQEATKLEPTMANLLAMKLSDNLKGAVGIIDARFPRMPVKSWISQEGYTSKIDLQNIYARSCQSEETIQKAFKEWALTGNSLLQIPETLTNIATATHNGMIAPVLPYSFRGLVWYESGIDMKSTGEYATLLPVLVQDLRLRLKQEQLPIIMVQLGQVANNGSILQEKNSPAALLRQSQYKSRLIPRNFLIVTADLEDPTGKTEKPKIQLESEITDRILAVALSTQYQKYKPYKQPYLEYLEPQKESLRLAIGNAQGQLVSKDGDTPLGFEIAGLDHSYLPAKARLEGTAIILESPEIKKPLYARYAWSTNPRLSIFNGEGLPLSPFASDR